MKTGKQQLGQKGEAQALAYLQAKGYQLVTRNYRFGRGEIDLILVKDEILVFAEVKSFFKPPLDLPELRVNKAKQQKIIETGYGFLSEHPQFENYNVRFDVLVVDFSHYPAKVRHYPAAFWLEEPF